MAEGASIDVLLKSLINQKFFDCIIRKEIANKNSELTHYTHLVNCNPNLDNSWLMKPKPKKFESEEESIGFLPKNVTWPAADRFFTPGSSTSDKSLKQSNTINRIPCTFFR